MSSRISLVALLLAGGTASAQQLPSAGQQIQQIPPAPAARPSIPEIHVERPGAPAAPLDAGPAFSVAALHVTGATVFPEAALLAVTGFQPGTALRLGDLRAMAARITDFYTRQGYFVAQAYLPAQTLGDGSVTIAVVEGHYGRISVRNHSRVGDRVTAATLHGLDAGDIIANAPLERRLLLLSDLPAAGVKSTLMPGTDVGTSDLVIDVLPGHRVTGSVEADDAGNRYTGYFRAGGTVNLNEPLGIGDVASVHALVSNEGLTYVRGAYQAPLLGATVGAAYARLDYHLHREFASLGAHGSADIASVYASYPLVRSFARNVNLVAGVDFKWFRDDIDSVAASSRKRSTVGFVGLAGDGRDHFGGGGSSLFSAIVSTGSLDIRTPSVRAADALTTRSNGGFTKVSLAAGRLQTVSGPLSLYVAARGQIAADNLDISEKMELGGLYGVRAYPEGEAYGDDAYVVTAEARLDLAALSRHVPGDVRLFGFVDHGGVTFNHDRFAAGANHASLTGAGAGIGWSAPGSFEVKALYAHRIGSTRVTSQPDSAGRVWVALSKSF